MPATLRLYAYGLRPIPPGVCAICSGVVCPIYTRRISIYSGVYLVRPGDVLYVPAYARYTPSVSLYAPSDTPCAYGPFPSLWRVPCVCFQRIPPIQAFFRKPCPFRRAWLFTGRKAMRHHARINKPPLHPPFIPAYSKTERDVRRALALASAIYTRVPIDRKSTRLNSSHANISYAVFCLKKNPQPQPVRQHSCEVHPSELQ